jgi:hypothetical protein
VPKLRAKHDLIVDVIAAVVCSYVHATIIALEQLFVYIPVALSGDAPFIPPHKAPLCFQTACS